MLREVSMRMFLSLAERKSVLKESQSKLQRFPILNTIILSGILCRITGIFGISQSPKTLTQCLFFVEGRKSKSSLYNCQ